jgi:hypothetical protein
MLTYLVRRLGTSIILFAYLYLAHSKRFQDYSKLNMQPSAEIRLAMIVIALGVFIILFRSAFTAYARDMDVRAFPVLDRFVLFKLNRGDLLLPALRQKSRAVLEVGKSLLVLAVLVCLCLFLAPSLAAILFAITLLVGFIAIRSGAIRSGTEGGGPHAWLARMLSQPDNYVDIALNTGLIFGFLVITKDGALISGTVLILMIARFSGAFRMLAVNIVNLVRWRKQDQAAWKRQIERQARRAEAELEKRLRQEEKIRLRAEAALQRELIRAEKIRLRAEEKAERLRLRAEEEAKKLAADQSGVTDVAQQQKAEADSST